MARAKSAAADSSDNKRASQRNEKAKSLADQAYCQLREDIITCKLHPGNDLSEQDLAESLKMSKTPVREALARLALEGLVEVFPRRGYRVTPVTVKSVNDVFTVRKALEGVACELAAVRMDGSEIDQVEELSQARYIPGEEPTVASFIKANNAFHSAIAEASRVPRLKQLIDSYLEESTRLFHMGAAVRDVNPETIKDHARIVTALRAHDPDAAREAIHEHTENTRHGLLTALISDRESLLVL
ncbi:GntR family transcriptional regulator [uncultured Cohaesibacter sp.]|uniref:GntR family transcriptional regulator n=1 Tax=uncultured Cohaesibacter sp. TaxID=1002546 RepID=UPI0029C8D672|nr:GntR family transcriptional regulator [uncultured Cohaesibacter sp.]